MQLRKENTNVYKGSTDKFDVHRYQRIPSINVLNYVERNVYVQVGALVF
jgi:hypothetical protein